MQLKNTTQRLSDTNLGHLLTSAQTCDAQGIGYGDIILLVEELQERRAALADRLPDTLPDEITNTTVMEGLIKRVEAGEFMLDKHVLGLFNAWKKQRFFQTLIPVNKKALERVLSAFRGHDHEIRELMATRNLPSSDGVLNPIDQLFKDHREALNAAD